MKTLATSVSLLFFLSSIVHVAFSFTVSSVSLDPSISTLVSEQFAQTKKRRTIENRVDCLIVLINLNCFLFSISIFNSIFNCTWFLKFFLKNQKKIQKHAFFCLKSQRRSQTKKVNWLQKILFMCHTIPNWNLFLKEKKKTVWKISIFVFFALLL